MSTKRECVYRMQKCINKLKNMEKNAWPQLFNKYDWLAEMKTGMMFKDLELETEITENKMRMYITNFKNVMKAISKKAMSRELGIRFLRHERRELIMRVYSIINCAIYK